MASGTQDSGLRVSRSQSLCPLRSALFVPCLAPSAMPPMGATVVSPVASRVGMIFKGSNTGVRPVAAVAGGDICDP